MQKYETIFIVDSLLKSEEIEAIIAKYERFISDNGGQIDAIEKWGKKRLAYEIKKRQYGYYVLIRFEGPGAMIKQLEREYRLNESILRYLTLQLTKQALKAMENQMAFAQAKKSPKAEAPAAAETTAGESAATAEEQTDAGDQPAEAAADQSGQDRPEPAQTELSRAEDNTKDISQAE